MLKILKWLAKIRCCSCGLSIDDGIVCIDCFKKLTFISCNFCKICGKHMYLATEDMVCAFCLSRNRKFTLARSLFLYNEISVKIVRQIKEYADIHIARRCCDIFLKSHKDMLNNIDIITCIPSHWSKVFKRGFNGAQIIGVELSRLSGIPFLKTLKQKIKTNSQKYYGFSERQSNLNGCFAWNKKDIRNKSILLVDDIMTTGATLDIASQELLQHGAKKISCFTIATTQAMENS